MYLLIPGLVCALYILLKVIEAKYLIPKGVGGGSEEDPSSSFSLKGCIKDSLFILLSFIGTTYLMGYIKPFLHLETDTPIFTGDPGF